MGAAESAEDRPHVVCQEGGLADKLASQVKQLQMPYTPPAWAHNPTVHMIASAATRSVMFGGLKAQRQLVTVPADGGTISLDWFSVPPKLDRSASTLTGPADSLSWGGSSSSFANILRTFSRSTVKTKDDDALLSPGAGEVKVGGVVVDAPGLNHRIPSSGGGAGVGLSTAESNASALRQSMFDDVLPPQTPVVMVLHAFAGSSREHYCRALGYGAVMHGWRAVGLNSRGCGDTPLTSPKPFTAALTGDVAEAVKAVKHRFPEAPVFLVGFSNGAYTVAKYLSDADSGVLGPDARVAGGVAVDCGYDYAAEMNKIQTSRSCLNMDFLERHFWHSYVNEHKLELNKCDRFDFAGMKTAKTVTELEAALICPAWGYDQIEDYYDDINSLRHIPNIRTPTLFMSAADDLFLAKTTLLPPLLEALKSNPWTVLAMTQRGSHCGFMTAEGWTEGRSLVDVVALQFFDAVLAHLEEAGGSSAAATPSPRPADPAGTPDMRLLNPAATATDDGSKAARTSAVAAAGRTLPAVGKSPFALVQ